MSGFAGGGGGVPVGTIAAHPANIPGGWLECNGAAISRADYAALFDDIGTDYGVGDGVATFNLPDLRGEFIRGFDNGRGVDSGRVLGAGQSDEIKSHAHNYKFDGGIFASGTSPVASIHSSAGTENSGKILNTGGAETRPRNIAMYQCIKY